MKLYRTRTKKEYDWLMNKLEGEFRRWEGGELPTEVNTFCVYGENTVIEDDRDGDWGILYGHVEFTSCVYQDVPIIEVSDLMEVEQ